MQKYQRTLLLIALALLMIVSMAAAAAAEKTDTSAAKTEPLKKIFNDVAATDNNALFINYLADLQIISGYADGSFKAKEGLTRAQAAVILTKAAGLENPAVDKSGFADVAPSHWAAASIEAAVKAGYIKGYPDGTYHPEEKLTRAQGISLLLRLSKQAKEDELPALKDMPQTHWAAADMATAINAGMIGLSEDKTLVYPEAEMSRGSLARALGTLLTKDPGLYGKTLSGAIKDIKGEIKLIRNGSTTALQNGTAISKGDTITTGANSTASIMYPDGSSVLIKENTELHIKESLGRAYIKKDGSSATAVENVDIELKKGTIFGALATKQGTTQEKQQAQSRELHLASLDGLGYIAENSKTPPWYQQAEAKKVKMKVDMPYGVAAVRGTFILVTVNQDGSCNVSCLTGEAEVGGTSGNTVPLGGGHSSGVVQGGTVAPPAPMGDKDKQQFSAVQQWVVNTALQIDVNKEVTAPPVVEMIVEIPDQPLTPTQQTEQVNNTLDVVLNALAASGIQLTEQVKNDLKQQLQQIQQDLSEQAQQNLENPNAQTNQNNSPTVGGGGNSEESTVNYINYATAGTYGPENAAAAQTISKNVIISAPGVTLRNMIIIKDLTLGAGIGEGSVTLKNVKIQGNTNIVGGGPNSITLEDSELYTVTVNSQNNTVRIVAQGNTMVGALTLNSGAKLEESQLSGSGFSAISTGSSIPAGTAIILSGSFAAVNLDSPELTIQLEPGSSINTLAISAQANISGAGQIMNAVISAEGVTMQQSPLNWSTASGVSFTVAGQSRTGSSAGNARLFSLSLSGGILSPAFSPDHFSYSASVGNSVYEVTLSAIPQESTATITVKVNGGVSNAGNTHVLNMEAGPNAIEILVTSPDGTASQEYGLNITRAGSASKTISEFKFNGLSPAVIGSISEASKTIALTVPYGTNLAALVPTITHTGASVSPASGVAQNFISPVTYTVTAEDGSTQAYTVTVTAALNSAKAIGSFEFTDINVIGTVDENAKTISMTVPYGTDLTGLIPTIGYSGASVSPASGVAHNFTGSVTYTVTAEDGSTQVYTVTVTEAPNSAKAIGSFEFTDINVIGTVDENAKTISMTVPYGTDLTALVPTITHTGASVSPVSGVAQNFTGSVTYTVTAEDGSTQAYTVTVTEAPNSVNGAYIARDDNSNTLVLLNVGSNLEYTTDATDGTGSGGTWSDGTGSEIIISTTGMYVIVREKANTPNTRCLGYINSPLGNQLLRTGTITIDSDCTNLFAYNGITDQIEISKLSGSTDLDESKAKVYVANALPAAFNSSGAVNPAGNAISSSDLVNIDIARVSISGMTSLTGGNDIGITIHYYGANGSEGSDSADDEWFLPSAAVRVKETTPDGGIDDYIDIADPSGDKIRIATVQSNASEGDYIWCYENGYFRTENVLDSNKQLLIPGNIFTNPLKCLDAGDYVSVATEDQYTGNVFIRAGYGSIPAAPVTVKVDASAGINAENYINTASQTQVNLRAVYNSSQSGTTHFHLANSDNSKYVDDSTSGTTLTEFTRAISTASPTGGAFTDGELLTLSAYLENDLGNRGLLVLNTNIKYDITPPSLSGAGFNQGCFDYTSNEQGTYYYLVYLAGDNPPDQATIKAQGSAVDKGTGTAFAATNTVSLSGLTPSEFYKAYLIVEDVAQNISGITTIEFQMLLQYTLSYNGNGNDGGAVPDSASYISDGSATVAGNTGSLTRAGCTFIGWNTAADWTGTDYAAGATIDAAADTILYAKWRLDTTPTAANLGFKYDSAYLEVTNAALPSYTTLEIFISGSTPTEAAPGSNEAKYTLDLTNSSNRVMGWHDAGSSPAINCNYYIWYRYVYGAAKSDWVQDGQPLGYRPVKGGSGEYDFAAVDLTHITLNNTGSVYNGYHLMAIRSSNWVDLGTISSTNQSFTVQPNDQFAIRDTYGNYSYESVAYTYP